MKKEIDNKRLGNKRFLIVYSILYTIISIPLFFNMELRYGISQLLYGFFL